MTENKAGSTSPHRTPPAPASILHALQSLGYIIVVAVFIITFTAQPFRIPSESMEPTLLVGDFLLVAKQNLPTHGPSLVFPSAALHRGDVVVFHFPVDPSMHLVKRIIGLPGDHLRLKAGHVLINGTPLREPYAIYQPSPPDNFRDNFPHLENPDPDVNSNWWIQMHHLVDHGELIVPTGHYFVLGDNRNDSEDSRYWGFVPAAAIVGKPFLIYFSLNQPDRPADDDSDSDSNDSDRPRLPAPHPTSTGPLSPLANLFNFARWDRTFRIVR